jgi:hypothetical protein
MNTNFLKITLGLALTAFTINANAQKAYTEGTAVYDATAGAVATQAKVSFKGDSSATSIQQGPAAIKIISFKEDYLAILVDVPVASLKKAAIATPAELEEELSKLPTFTFTPTTETKQISGFNCKKVIAKDAKSGSSYDTWVTTDISAPSSAFSKLYEKAGGFPVQFTINQRGTDVTNTLKSISGDKVPAGMFSVPAGFDRITLTDLNAMGGKR